ncbi:MAG: polysaccharide deacetylase [Clostridia bacterium]|nr:polysaccharide deacetylase [Clostridia bacterium]
MDEYRHYRRANRRKVIVIITILVFAFLIIVGSALLTNGARNKKNSKNTETSVAKADTVKTTTEEEANGSAEPDVKEANVTILGQEATETQVTKTESTSKTSASKTTKAASGRLPVANPDAVALCKQAQTAHVKDIYLTFDDGPSPNVTPQILSILEEYDVPATFFVLGSRAELYPELIRQEYEAGHYIANHGYTHTYSAIYSSVQSVIDEYNQTEKAVQDALGLPEYHTLLFRFPGGSSGGPYDSLKGQAKSKLEGMGIASTNWNCLNGDAEGGARTKEQLINRLYSTAEGWDSLVVLMHDANDKQTTADALPEIIEHYKAEGYTFKNYYEIFQ